MAWTINAGIRFALAARKPAIQGASSNDWGVSWLTGATICRSCFPRGNKQSVYVADCDNTVTIIPFKIKPDFMHLPVVP